MWTDRVEAAFIDSEHGPIFSVCHWARCTSAPTIIHLPAFAEEMNRCRAHVARTARELASNGINVIIFDPVGTGDSAGEFNDFSFEGLTRDLVAVERWLEDRTSGPRALWGLRLGASIAVQMAVSRATTYAGLLLWSPIINGARYLKQFLRIRTSAEFGRESAGKITVAELENRLHGGENLDVGGYCLTPRLAKDLEELDLSVVPVPELDWLAWIESIPSEGGSPPATVQTLQQAWSSKIDRCRVETVIGPAFWNQVEPQPSPDLEERTCGLLAELIG